MNTADILQSKSSRKRVFVGLSGGVDSAVSAALLLEQGYDVTGVFIKIWQPEFLECTWRKDRLDALRVAAALNIPFKEIDLSLEYKERVVDTMIAEYKSGRTPNPDVLCNGFIKFGTFMDWALEQGAEYVATGHYAQVAQSETGEYVLKKGKDANKDQSYFLWQIRKENLAKILMPVGGLTKPEVREIALRLNLPNAKKKDSQGLCFVGDVDMDVFLQRFMQTTPGDVVNRENKVVGVHKGSALYTPGQRHGFATDGTSQKFVVRTDVQTNTIEVSDSVDAAYVKKIGFTGANWRQTPTGKLLAQTRYREEPVPVTIENNTATFAEPHLAVNGQSLVVYDKDICIGGALIGIPVYS